MPKYRLHKASGQAIAQIKGRRLEILKRVFRWGVAEELVPAHIWQALDALEGVRKGRTKAPEPVPNWTPNRLRHTAGTNIRHQFGLEAAQVAGHRQAAVTQIYADRDEKVGIEVVCVHGGLHAADSHGMNGCPKIATERPSTSFRSAAPGAGLMSGV